MKRIFFENLLRGSLLVSLALMPLPFGMVESRWNARAAVVFGTIALVSLLFAATKRSRFEVPMRMPVAVAGCFGFLLLAAIQLAPLGESVVSVLSPDSAFIWNRGALLSRMMGGEGTSARLSIDMRLTASIAIRLVTLASILIACGALIRRRRHRYWMVAAIACSAVAQFVLAFRQWIDPDPANTIWGWRNAEIVNRVSGTFVNPNHFAHYLALAIPICVYAAAAVIARRRGVDRGERLQRFFERGLLPFVGVAAVILACVGGIFLAQSRGTVLALAAAIAITGLLTIHHVRRAGRSRRSSRMLLLVSAALSIFALVSLAVVVRFGEASTVRRMLSLDDQSVSLRGRVEGIEASIEIWTNFPVFGSGLGTFERLSWMKPDRDALLRHAHNDYLEILATGGLVGFALLIVALALILRDFSFELQRHAIERKREDADRRMFLLAALATLVFVMVHALYDFNAFVPSNPFTAAAIIGAASAARPKKIDSAQTNSIEE